MKHFPCTHLQAMTKDAREKLWYALAGNERLCRLIAEYFGWEYKIQETSNAHTNLCLVNTGREWVSMPHLSYGGTSAEVDYQKLGDLLDIPVERWQIRDFKALSPHYTCQKVISYLIPEKSEQEQLKQFSSSVRRKINKAIKNGLTVVSGGEEILDDFYTVLTHSNHHLGAPALPAGFFRILLNNFHNGINDYARIFVAYQGEKPIGAAFLLGSGTFYENTWFGSLRKYNRLYTTYLLHWQMIRAAISRGGQVYSLGRSSKESGVHRYKRQWTSKEKPLVYNYSYPRKHDIKQYKLLARAWRLVPYPLAKTIGPWFAARLY